MLDMSEEFIQLTPNLWLTQSPLYATNSGIFISQGQACLIDPGIAPDKLAAIEAFLEDQVVLPRTLIITHAHWDHMMGPEHFPNLPVVAHMAYNDMLETRGDDLKKQIAKWRKHDHIKSEHSYVLPQATYKFSDELRLTVGECTLQLLSAPGHAPDQLVIYHAESGTLWAGDMLSEREIPMVMGSLDAYQTTLARLAQLDVHILIPGHGTPTTDVDEIQTRFTQDRAYLDELHERITQAITQGLTKEEVWAACEDITFAQPSDNATAHRWNVESCFVALGGTIEEDNIGWEQDWET